MIDVLAILAIALAIATPNFVVLWTWFGFWRRHHVLTIAWMLGAFAGGIVAMAVLRRWVLGPAIAMPVAVQVVGWVIAALANVLGFVADRQLGMYVRAFTPFFEESGRIALRTGGAYRVVRHPIYAAGIYFQVGMFLVTGYLAIAIAGVVLTLGALWFTRQEERRLVTLLAEPAAYDAYRARVPALFPWPR